MQIEQEYKQYIEKHPIECKKSALAINDAIIHSELNAGGLNYTHTLHIPKFFSQADKALFQSITHTCYGIFSKVIQAYKTDSEIRALFPFSKELEELILLPTRYDVPIPICRIDIFLNEENKDFFFCEFNTDGTAAMNENQRLNEFLSLHNIFQKDTRHYTYMELVDSWAKAFMELIQNDPKMPEKPMIAICDFLENAYLNELYVFQQVFKKYGCFCEVLDMRDLVFEEGSLYSVHTHRKIDAIYRRAVTSDLMKNKDLCPSFFEAVKADAISLIGSFQTELIHHKEIMSILFHPAMQAYFTKEEINFLEKHSPKTYDLDASLDLSEKDRWIIKPKDSYGAKGVWAGVDLSESRWKDVVKECLGKEYIVQTYISPYKTKNIDLARHDDFQDFSNMTGLYVFNGHFRGVYSRLSDSGIISSQYNERTIPTLFVEEEN